MRVLHVIASQKRRGAEVFAADLIGALGNRVNAPIRQKVAVLHPSNEELDFGVATEVIGGNDAMKPAARWHAGVLLRLRSLIKSWSPDLIQAHGGEPLKYCLVAAAGNSAPVVYRRIGAAPDWIRHGFRNRTHSLLMRRAAKVVAVAEAVRQETVELFGVDAEQVITIPNGVDLERLGPRKDRGTVRASLGIPQEVPVVISVGSLTWEKDPMAHLEIGAQVVQKFPDAIHLILGDGPMRSDLAAAIRRKELDQSVRLLGSRPDVGDLLTASDVLLFASRTGGMEGMPACVIEAGMVGLPVIGYSVAGVPEVVVDGSTGVLVAPGDLQELGNRVAEVLADADRRRDLGHAARERCIDRFEISKVASLYGDLYEELSVSA